MKTLNLAVAVFIAWILRQNVLLLASRTTTPALSTPDGNY